MVADLLLLNATNLPWRPIFPYAFVQVSAVARRNGLRVKTVDLLDVPRERWAAFLETHICEQQPRMIGLHIRQSDSVYLDDYYSPAAGPDTRRTYFPIDDNVELVKTLRTLTAAPLIAGGIGYTTHAKRLLEHLGIDFGVQGDPDDVFAHFDDVVARRNIETIKSLIFRDRSEVRCNERGYYAPYEGIEYTDDVFDDMVRFYGHAQLFGSNPPTVAVEVMRGCPFSCFFCTEPHVKGRTLRYRDLAVVEEELDGLMKRHIRRFWLVCSELDVQGVKFAMTLAELFVRLQQKHGGSPVEWSAYALPRLEESELRILQKAGYAGALNDVLSLEDANLRAARVPYRSKQAVAFLQAVTKLDREEAASAAYAAAAEKKVRAGLTQRTPKELATILGLFLGNAHATPSTISETLRRIETEGLQQNYRMGLPFASTRVFELDGEPICRTTPRGLHSYGPDGERPVNIVEPTYYYPEFLLDRLGSPDGILEFMRYVGETFMSTGHRARKDWAWFLSNHTSIDELGALASAAGRAETRDDLRELLSPAAARKQTCNAAAKALVDHVFVSQPVATARMRRALGIPDEKVSEYRLMELLYAQFESRDAVFAAAAPSDPLERLYVAWLLYDNNVVIKPEYRELLFGSRQAA